jgi:hypothetical protein
MEKFEIQEFKILKKAGEGVDGIVFQAQHVEHKTIVALKFSWYISSIIFFLYLFTFVISRQPIDKTLNNEGIPKEAAFLSDLSNHSNIVHCYGWGIVKIKELPKHSTITIPIESKYARENLFLITC